MPALTIANLVSYVLQMAAMVADWRGTSRSFFA